MFTNRVEYQVAEMLNNRINSEEKYAAEEVVVTWDNMLGSGKFKKGELITDGDYIHGKYYMAPTYAEIIDYLFYNKKVVIEFIPAFTYSLQDRVAYYIKAYKINEEAAKLDCIFSDEMSMYSFDLGVETILKKVLEEEKDENS